MNTQSLGSLFDVSRLTLGGGGIGQVWGATSRDEAIATVRLAHERGITLFDMAPLYGDGEAETVMGLAFPDGYPADVRVTTKCMLGATPAGQVEAKLTSSLDASLARLGRDTVDVYILHGYVIPDDWRGRVPPELLARIAVTWSTYESAVIPTFEKLVASGRIGAWGITAASVQATNLQAIQSDRPPGVVQCIANVLDSPGGMAIDTAPPAPRAVIDAARARGVGVMGIRAVAAGALTEQIDRDVKPGSREQGDYDRAEPLRAIARERGVSTAHLAHQYALAMPGVDTLVLGVKNQAELTDCLAAEAAPALSPDVIHRLDEAVKSNAGR